MTQHEVLNSEKATLSINDKSTKVRHHSKCMEEQIPTITDFRSKMADVIERLKNFDDIPSSKHFNFQYDLHSSNMKFQNFSSMLLLYCHLGLNDISSSFMPSIKNRMSGITKTPETRVLI